MRIRAQEGIVKLIKFGIWLVRKWRKETHSTSWEKKDSSGNHDVSWNEQMLVIKTEVILEDFSPHLQDRTRNNRLKRQHRDFEEILGEALGGIRLLQKFLISLDKQSEWYGLLRWWPLETSAGDKSSRWEGVGGESIPCPFLILENYRLCYWITLLRGGNGKHCPFTPWERVWKAGSWGKVFISGALLLSYARSFNNWKDVMNCLNY